MRVEPISLKEYEAAERELAERRAKRFWLWNATLFAVAAAIFAIVEAGANGALWWPYVLLILWVVVLVVHRRWAIQYGDVHKREEQIRIEWRAGRSKEKLVPR
jgi:fatty acid desaturase